MNDAKQKENEDGRLIGLAAKGNEEAIQTIVEQHQGMVYGTCLRILKNEADAKDAAQATFLVFLKKCRKLKRGTVLGGWLYHTAGFVARESIRASVRHKNREEEAATMEELEARNTSNEWKDLEPELDEAVMALPQKYKDIVVLRYLEGRSTGEVADIMGMSASSVTTNLARGIDKLRVRFQRKGIVFSAVALTAVLAKNASAASVSAAVNGVAASSLATAVSAQTSLLVNSALTKMYWAKAKIVGLAAIFAASAFGIHVCLTDSQVDALNLTQKQTKQANVVMQAHRSEYLEIEKKHTTYHREEENLVQLTVAAFPEERKDLKARFWEEFDKVCIDERQREVARRRISTEFLFPYGNRTHDIKISFDGKAYNCSDYYTFHGNKDGGSTSASSLDPQLKRFWGDREEGIFRASLLGMACVSGNPEPKENPIRYSEGLPVLTDDFVQTLDLDPEQAEAANRIFESVFKEYLVVEKKYAGDVVKDPDGTMRVTIPSFSRERKAVVKKLWSELAKVFDERQMRIAMDTISMKFHTNLFSYGNMNYTVAIEPTNKGFTVCVKGKRFLNNCSRNGHYRKLPDRYSRLLVK
jgi:RNA polymerase sigma factor (sigma-70 family)